MLRYKIQQLLQNLMIAVFLESSLFIKTEEFILKV